MDHPAGRALAENLRPAPCHRYAASFLHSLNAYLTKYCKDNLSDAQFASLVHLTGSKNWKRLEFIVHLLFSIQPSILLGSVQISAAGNSDQLIHIEGHPHPENVPAMGNIVKETNPNTGEEIQH